MKKRILCAALALCVMLSVLTVFAGASEGEDAAGRERAAEELSVIGMFRGTGSSFALERTPTRAEAATMLVRVYGAEDIAAADYAAGFLRHPFADGQDWSAPYIAWLYENGITRGMSETFFGAGRTCPARDYMVFLLRALGYRDGEDFTYAAAELLAASLGFYQKALFSGAFTRGDMALMTRLALEAPVRSSGVTLLDQLIGQGAVSERAAEELRSSSRKPLYLLRDGDVLLREDAWSRAAYGLRICVRFEAGYDDSILGEHEIGYEELSELTGRAEDGYVVIRQDALDALVSSWTELYAGDDLPFRFYSACKGLIPINYIRCSYRVDTDALEKQILEQLLTLESGTVYARLAAYDRSGARLDLGGTYVEVDIDNQKLTFVKNGAVIVSTDIVTGNPAGHRTPTGLYYAHNKQTNITLVGADYAVFVNYWVSVIGDSIGLHDASWRWQFGGDIYTYNGSHGCVNIPGSAMQIIYDEIEDGTPVLIHGGV